MTSKPTSTDNFAAAANCAVISWISSTVNARGSGYPSNAIADEETACQPPSSGVAIL